MSRFDDNNLTEMDATAGLIPSEPAWRRPVKPRPVYYRPRMSQRQQRREAWITVISGLVGAATMGLFWLGHHVFG